MVRSCCFFINLRIGGYLIGCYDIIRTILRLVIQCILYHQASQTYKDSQQSEPMPLAYMLISVAINLVFNVLLIIGVRKVSWTKYFKILQLFCLFYVFIDSSWFFDVLDSLDCNWSGDVYKRNHLYPRLELFQSPCPVEIYLLGSDHLFLHCDLQSISGI